MFTKIFFSLLCSSWDYFALNTGLSFLLGNVSYRAVSIHFLKSCFCGHLWGVCDEFAISLLCMHMQTHTTYITVAFGMRISVSACTIWPSHNSAYLHELWLLGGIFALFQLWPDKEAFNCVFNEPEQETATIPKSFTGKGGRPSPHCCCVEKESEEGGPELRCSLN